MFQKLHTAQRFGNVNGRKQILGKVNFLFVDDLLQEASRRTDALDVGERPRGHHQAGALAREQFLDVFFGAVLKIDPFDVASRRHHRPHLTVVESKHVAHHVAFAFFNGARSAALFDHRVDFFLRDAGFFTLVKTQNLQDELRGNRKQFHEGAHDKAQQVKRTGDNARKRLGSALSQTFGNEFSENDREIRHKHHDERDAEHLGCFGRHAPAHKHLGCGTGQSRFAHDTRENADGGDAHLNGRKRPGGIGLQQRGALRSLVAVFGHNLQSRLATGDKRNFAHRKDAVENNQRKKH